MVIPCGRIRGHIEWFMTEADFTSHHIEGFARAALEQGKNGYFSVPLISQIIKDDGWDLWVGGCIDGVVLPDHFDYVLSLYPWEKFTLSPNTQRDEVKLYDSADVPDSDELYDLANKVVKRLDGGDTVLVHCQAGLNRSNLIAALAIVLGGDKTPEEAISLLRERRSSVVLCNQTFERWLLDQAGQKLEDARARLTISELR